MRTWKERLAVTFFWTTGRVHHVGVLRLRLAVSAFGREDLRTRHVQEWPGGAMAPTPLRLVRELLEITRDQRAEAEMPSDRGETIAIHA